ncbi:hypothetical protein IV73_GL001179 [Weissella kandleri]|uniref:Uncharacterized protein n=1 Tax=Weissella kandleri TaxID=1616 RepID=A0A0R2JBK8_9LACO|nr:hypothetical protein IV73_GL001179 [Weissella kandleri]
MVLILTTFEVSKLDKFKSINSKSLENMSVISVILSVLRFSSPSILVSCCKSPNKLFADPVVSNGPLILISFIVSSISTCDNPTVSCTSNPSPRTPPDIFNIPLLSIFQVTVPLCPLVGKEASPLFNVLASFA